jgi:hypothetical protein
VKTIEVHAVAEGPCIDEQVAIRLATAVNSSSLFRRNCPECFAVECAWSSTTRRAAGYSGGASPTSGSASTCGPRESRGDPAGVRRDGKIWTPATQSMFGCVSLTRRR